ncbi:MAG: hypothetical protein ACRC3H_02600 [Lachnospiraceae bacterium]
MWKVIQGDEKAGFIKECRDGKHAYSDITAIDLSEDCPGVTGLDVVSVSDFVSDDIVILVKVD